MCCLQTFSLSISIAFVFPIYCSLQQLQITSLQMINKTFINQNSLDFKSFNLTSKTFALTKLYSQNFIRKWL